MNSVPNKTAVDCYLTQPYFVAAEKFSSIWALAVGQIDMGGRAAQHAARATKATTTDLRAADDGPASDAR
jgi:hypothetical protein